MTKTTTPKHIVTFICLIALLFTGCGKEAPEPVQEKKKSIRARNLGKTNGADATNA